MIALIGAMHLVVAGATTPTPMPVFVTDFPHDPWAVIAALLSLLTLSAVGYQIFIAREELGVVREDLKNNKKLIDDAFRRPNLTAKFRQQNQLGVNQSILTNYIHASVFNSGERPSFTIRLEVLVPITSLANPTTSDTQRTVDGVEYETFPAILFQGASGTKHDPLFPNSAPLTFRSMFVSKAQPAGDVEILWRLYDEHGMYPADRYGRMIATAALLVPGTVKKLEPV